MTPCRIIRGAGATLAALAGCALLACTLLAGVQLRRTAHEPDSRRPALARVVIDGTVAYHEHVAGTPPADMNPADLAETIGLVLVAGVVVGLLAIAAGAWSLLRVSEADTEGA